MAQTDGEKELVLGNKQLVSFFFVVLALCGVFFALGYMIGRNSSKTGVAGLEGAPVTTADTPAAPRPQDSASEPPRDLSRDAAPAPSLDGARAPEPQPAAPQTQAAREISVAAAPAPRTASTEPTAPEAGATYLQVAAQHRSDAENLVRTLREQNFPAVLADSSKPDLFRVLVGPYRKTVDVADAKERLKTLGFANAFVMK